MANYKTDKREGFANRANGTPMKPPLKDIGTSWEEQTGMSTLWHKADPRYNASLYRQSDSTGAFIPHTRKQLAGNYGNVDLAPSPGSLLNRARGGSMMPGMSPESIDQIGGYDSTRLMQRQQMPVSADIPFGDATSRNQVEGAPVFSSGRAAFDNQVAQGVAANLAADPQYQYNLSRMRAAQDNVARAQSLMNSTGLRSDPARFANQVPIDSPEMDMQNRVNAGYAAQNAARQGRMSQMAAQVDKFNQKQMADTNGNGIPDIDEGIQESFGKYGLKSVGDLARMNAEYNSYMRGYRATQPKGQRAMSFDEFLKARQKEYQNLPAYGSTEAFKPGNTDRFEVGGGLNEIINKGRQVARESRTRPSDWRIQNARDQAAMTSAAAYARAHGMDPRMAVAAQANANQYQRAMEMENQARMQQIGAQGFNQLSLEAMRQAGLTGQRNFERQMQIAKLGNDMLGEMQTPKAAYDSAYQNAVTRIEADPRLSKMSPQKKAELAHGQAASAEQSTMAMNQMRLSQMSQFSPGFGGDNSIFTTPSGRGPDNQSIEAMSYATPTDSGAATGQDVIDAFRQDRVEGNSPSASSVDGRLTAQGKNIDTLTARELINIAQSKGKGWQEADRAFRNIYGVSPNSWEFWTKDWLSYFGSPFSGAKPDWENQDTTEYLSGGGRNWKDFTPFSSRKSRASSEKATSTNIRTMPGRDPARKS